MQALVLARLRAGREPGHDRDDRERQVKYYRYTLLRRETLKTAIGDVDTVVYRSARDGSSRETITWHAPTLGFAAVQAEQLIGGKRGLPDSTSGATRPGAWGLSPRQVLGSVTPFWPWYLPPRSLYEVSQTSSDSKNRNCATPSFA